MADRRDLATRAERLRALHRPGAPLVLANVWDATGAALVEAAGLAAVATSSGAVASASGYPDTNSMPVDVAFAAVARVAAATTLPVTADLEAGYGLSPDELVERLLDAGAVGCNLEDTDYGAGGLVEVGAQADRLAMIKAAGRAAGVDLVVNARVDVVLQRGDTPEARAETLTRALAYKAAGADCTYPITLSDPAALAELADAVGVVNAFYRRGGPTLAALAAAGVARTSVGSGLSRVTNAALQRSVEALRDGRDEEVW